MKMRRCGLMGGLAAALLCATACREKSDIAARPGLISLSIEPTRKLAASPGLLRVGRTTYQKECVACHGAKGDGEGERERIGHAASGLPDESGVQGHAGAPASIAAFIWSRISCGPYVRRSKA